MVPRGGQGDDADRTRQILGGEPGAVERVDRDVILGALAGAESFAVREHGRRILLALADHHGSRERCALKHRPHGSDGCLIGGVLVAAAHPGARGQSCRHGGGPNRGHEFGRMAHRADDDALGFDVLT